MPQVTSKFFHKGTDKQHRSDITIDLKHPEVSKMKQWSDDEKTEALKFIKELEGVFETFANSIRTSCSSNPS